MTLLEIVQDILNDIEGDEVNSISDTWEATQIANIVASTYKYLMTVRYSAHTLQLGQLDASGDADLPTHMQIPEDFQDIQWVKYNCKTSASDRDRYQEMTYMDPKDFVELCNSRNSTESTVDSISDPTGVTLLIQNNKNPQYYTSFDDEWIVFDSYDSDLDDTLRSSKTQVYGHKQPTLVIADSTVPDMPRKALPLLVSEAKSMAFVVVKQAPNPKEEARARKLGNWYAAEKYRVNGGIKTANYGRTRNGSGKNVKCS